MTDYQSVSLGNVLRLERRRAKVIPEAEYPEIGIYSYGRGIFHKPPRSGLEVGDKELYLIQDGDFIFQITFAWEGAVGLASRDEHGMYGSVRFPTYRVDDHTCFPQYLLYYFRTPQGRAQLTGISPGSAGRNRVLNLKRLDEIQVPLPPLDEQRRIVARIEALAARIAEARGLRRAAVAEVEALLIAMAHRGDLDLATKRHDGWREMLLGDVIRQVQTSQRVNSNSSYPNLGIYSFGRGLFQKAPIEGIATSATTLYRVHSGQFIYSRLFAFEGSYGQVTDEFDGYYVSSEYPTFDCDPQHLSADFLSAYFKDPDVWALVAKGSKGLGDRPQRVQPLQVLAHRIWLPPLKWQERIGDVQSRVDALKRAQAEIAAALDALLPAVLDRAFRGDL